MDYPFPKLGSTFYGTKGVNILCKLSLQHLLAYLCCKLIKFTYSSYKNIMRSMKCNTFKLIQCMVYCIKHCPLESRQNNVTGNDSSVSAFQNIAYTI